MSQPIKRHVSLQPLSRDHHHGLLLCWKIREGFKKQIDPLRIKRYADWFWKTHLAEHFRMEEEFVFPVLGNTHPHVQQALLEHRNLEELFMQTTDVSQGLSQLEAELEKHIRFEERVLFNEIQEMATAEQLAECERHHNSRADITTWEDEFWR
jgi:iron-sulfur cluster repair protein YtfE (RIC family)